MTIMLSRILELIGKQHGAGQQFVRAIGCPKNAVTDWKAGRSNSYKEYAPKIAKYYGVSLDWLSGLTDDRTGIKKEAPSEDEALDDRMEQRYQRVAALSEEQWKNLQEVMRIMGM